MFKLREEAFYKSKKNKGGNKIDFHSSKEQQIEDDLFFGGDGDDDDIYEDTNTINTKLIDNHENINYTDEHYINKEYENIGGNKITDAFDAFLKQQNTGGSVSAENDVREGYDSFTIVRASDGTIGGRFISKTPYTAAYKAASRLFKTTETTSLNFIMQKTTKGSNRRYYAYNAEVKYLSKPMLVFKNDEDGNKIIMNKHNQVLRINKNNKIINSTGDIKHEYNPDSKIPSLTSFNYKPYIIKEITKNITIKSTNVPDELKEEQKDKAKKNKTAEEKEMMKQKKAEKKARENEKKQLQKEKEKARKQKEKEKARREKEKEKIQAKKEMLKMKKMMLKGGNGMCTLNGC